MRLPCASTSASQPLCTSVVLSILDPAIHIKLVIAGPGSRWIRLTLFDCGRRNIGGLAQRHCADIDNLVRGLVEIEGEQPLVLGIESGDQTLDRQAFRFYRQRDFESLAGIADIDLVEQLDIIGSDIFRFQFPLHLRAEAVEIDGQLLVAGVLDHLVEAALGLDSLPRGRIAIGAEHAGRGRDDHRPAVHQLAHRIGVQRPGAAKAHQREFARVIALLDRDQPQRAEHILVDNIDDPGGRVHQLDAKRIGDRLHRFLRALAVELEAAAEQGFGQIA